MKRNLHLIFIIVISSTFCFAQVNKDETIIVEADANACELNSRYFDMISNEVFKSKERIFAIFRAGKSETENVNAKRLAHVKAFLEQVKGWERFDVVYARGEKIDGEGRIEFYVGGKIFLATLASKNKTPCLDCCGGGFASPQNLVKKKRKMKIYKKSK